MNNAFARRITLARRGVFAAVVIIVACLLFASLDRPYGAAAAREVAAPAVAPHAASIATTPHLVFRHTGIDGTYGALSLASLEAGGGGERAAAGLTCERVSFSSGRGICLQSDRGVITTYKAVLFDRTFTPRRTIELDGAPSRTRISSDGRVGAITVAESDVFAGKDLESSRPTLAARTTLVDMASGAILADLEQFATRRNGARFEPAEFSVSTVTFARDSNVFYASLRTRAATYLVRGDVGRRTLTVLHENVECPSLSPDNRLIAYKKRVGPQPDAWRLYVLDLATMTERPIHAETRFVDDQPEWLDNGQLLYAVPRPGTATSDAWVASVDGPGPARVFLTDAESPIVVR
jgi:hypothetical protein